jgi:hypothetical protein
MSRNHHYHLTIAAGGKLSKMVFPRDGMVDDELAAEAGLKPPGRSLVP